MIRILSILMKSSQQKVNINNLKKKRNNFALINANINMIRQSKTMIGNNTVCSSTEKRKQKLN